jgi:hypothetical protein
MFSVNFEGKIFLRFFEILENRNILFMGKFCDICFALRASMCKTGRGYELIVKTC